MDRNKKFINDAKKKFGDDYEYLTKYENQYQKLKIRCVKHDHVFIQHGKQHLKAKVPCSICREEVRKEKIKQEFIEEFEGKYPNLKVVDYTHGTHKTKPSVTILFKECGHTEHFTSGNDYILNRGDECPTCHPKMEKMHDARNAKWDSSKDKRLKEIKTKLEKIHDNAFGYDEIEFTGNVKDKVKILCKKHNSYFFQTLHDHGRRGIECCPECRKEGKEKRGLEKEVETFNTRITELPHLEVLTDFLGWEKYLKIKCKNCDEITEYNKEQEGADNIYIKFFSSKYGCPICSDIQPWEDWEIQHLNKLISNRELHEKYLPHRTVVAIKSKRAELELRATDITGRKSWIPAEEAKERVRISNKKYIDKMMKDPVFKFIRQTRITIGNSFRAKDFKKCFKTEEIIGLRFDKFIEYLFDHPEFDHDHWTLENRGEIWHVDHIVPIDYAKTIKEVVKLNHYTNLKPRWATTAIAETHGVFDKIGNLNKRNSFVG
tara:strand:- start:31803 stop:33269 length:1467 start_codon:yes stop_codon:yes gene_type:complete